MDRLYPRPNLVRSNWQNLNGTWDFDFDDQNIGIAQQWYKQHQYSKKIRVPFGYQTQLSGIHDVSMHDRVWYRRKFKVDQSNKRLILHFEAVDYEAHVYLNHKLVKKHVGGSTRFSVDITDFIVDGEQDLVVMAYDPSLDAKISRGKQTERLEPYECYYDRTTGIWQTVWLEYIDESAIETIKITPNIDEQSAYFKLTSFDHHTKTVDLQILWDGRVIKTHQFELGKYHDFKLKIPAPVHLWSPETPNLYDIKVTVTKNGAVIDEFSSYFGMRKISIKGDKILLNNEPYYLRLILDQGYYEEGLISYPTEEALKEDIILAKQMGFNGARKHQKIEAQRWMYYADTLGFLVSLEMPSQYAYEADNRFIKEWIDAVARDYNHPSLFMYVPFNESWGVQQIKDSVDQQNYVIGFYHLTKSLDPTRIVVSNDGWEQPVTEVCTIHSYRHGQMDDQKMHEAYYKSLTDKDTLLSATHTNGDKPIYVGGATHHHEPILFSEFGGVSFANEKQVGWGYTGVTNAKDYEKELKRIFKAVHDSKHLAGFCFTQLTDVEQEINGLLGYDRKPKLPLDTIKKIVTNK